jgi:N-acetylglucosaminyl-diphospho-decaprenol L-rhamnosyltransferase
LTVVTTAQDLSVLIVTYNSRPFIDACLEALLCTVQRHTFEVLVLDNDSQDGTAEHVRRAWPSVRVVQMGSNAGFAAANNVGVTLSAGRHVLLLNGDAVVEDDAVDILVETLDQDPRVGVAAPQVLNPDRSDQGTARRFPTPAAALWGRRSPLTRAFPRVRYAQRYLSGLAHIHDVEPYDVDWVSGACMMMPRSVVEKVGGLDAGFFMHWEDADLCRRIKGAGHVVRVSPTARVVHSEGGSRRGWPPKQVAHFHRGAYRYYSKHHLQGVRVAGRPLAAVVLMARALLVMAVQSPARFRPRAEENRKSTRRQLLTSRGDAG